MRIQSLMSVILLLVFFCSISYSQPAGDVRTNVDSLEAAVLLKTDSDFNKLSIEKGFVEAFLSYMADSAMLFPNGSNLITGKENIKNHLSEGPANAVLTWKPLKAEVAESGDLGYTYGSSEYKFKGDDGKPAVHYGKYITVWKRQCDGSWKFILDIGNPSPAPGGK